MLDATDSNELGNPGAMVQQVASGASGLILNAPDTLTVGTWVETLVGGVSLAEANAPAGETFTITLSTSDGSFLTDDADGAANVIGNNSSLMTITGSLAGVNAELQSLAIVDGSTQPTEITLTASDSDMNVAGPHTIEVVTNAVPCFVAGTMIATPGGELPVELLAIGDLVTVQSGAARPVKWLGRRSYAGRFLAGQTHILPVRIRAGALADGVPRRDLRVSPRHAMLVDGVLVQASDLINDASIVQETDVARVDYIHIEMEDHDIVLAEGAASETFVDDDSRAMFQNAADYAALYPDEAPRVARFCAPRLENGYALHAVWQRIASRAGQAAPTAPLGKLRGYVDMVATDRVCGWAQDLAYPEAPVCLDILVDGVVMAQTLASRYRADLAATGLGSGRHAFEVTLPEQLSCEAQRRVTVRRSADHATLFRIPRVTARSGRWSAAA